MWAREKDMTADKKVGVVIYGATGYTGKLVAEYMYRQYGIDGEVSWAIAGRSLEKLEAVREELSLPAELPLVVADASDPASLASMVENCAVVLTTVGPYQLYGSDLVGACARSGTDYVDLCGEPNWMKQMIDEHGEAARSSGARIVFSCGFDSIPFDLGVFFLQRAAIEEFGAPVPRIRGRVREMNGTWSGGTLASFKATMAAAAKNPELVGVLMNPFALTEGFVGAEQPDGLQPMYDSVLESWVAPFMMATINTKNIHRSNLMLDHMYGEDFVYDEMVLTGPGEQGEAIAKAVAGDKSMANDTTQPGEGPTREQRENGNYDILFVGETAQGKTLRAGVKGDMDPGYGSTSKMIAESAVALLLNPEAGSGGVQTPAPAMAALLLDRLQQNAGISFALE
jgi:short subunit dehydrogenase-like uncharacterized protein